MILNQLRKEISNTLNKKYTLRVIVFIIIAMVGLGYGFGYGKGVADTTSLMVNAASKLLDIEFNDWALSLVMERYPEIIWLIPEIADGLNVSGCLENDLSDRCDYLHVNDTLNKFNEEYT